MRQLPFVAVLIAATPSSAHPAGDLIPLPFHGLYGRTAASCDDPDEIAFLYVGASELTYYEADEYLLLGIAMEGPDGPVFNGRFISRMETQIGSEENLQLALESPDRLVRLPLGQDADEPAPQAQRDVWIRCPPTSLHARQAREDVQH